MTVLHQIFRVVGLAGVFVALGFAPGFGQHYPNRTVKIVVPVPPGPLLDTLPRMIGEKLSAKWGQPVVIENRPGASQNIGAEAVFRAEPDGYTLLVSPPAPLVVGQHLSPKPSFDANAFVPVTQLIAFPHVIVANPKVPVTDLADLIAYAQEHPNKLSYGSPGAASTPQLAMEKLLADSRIRIQHVPYQGMGPAQRDLIAGHIDVMFDAPGNVIQQIAEGKLKPLAVTGGRRIAELPDVPTVSETLAGSIHSEWFAMVAPPGTPPDIAHAVSQAVAETLRQPDVSERLRALAVTPVGNSPIDAAAFLKQERERWRQIVAAVSPPTK
jgi:tripartite-type tricarboxylate transporter receptor subunit TctC